MFTNTPRRRAAGVAAIAGLATVLASPASEFSAKPELTQREAAIHVLNRLGFGPRPGDVDRVLAMGIPAYVERQISPEGIPDAAVEASLKRFATLSMTASELYDRFEKPIRENRHAKQADLPELARIPPENRPRRILEELSEAKILRAERSERQLNEVLVDFWMNHFNIFAGKGLDRIYITSFERDVVRPRIWGKFEDLLLATAKSPAMLFYLDNAQSVADPDHRAPRPLRFARFLGEGMRPAKAGGGNGPGGLNENYARELMELHTLGVDGGYTQRDVTELARVLTGWSLVRPEQGTGFVFRAPLHDVGSKTVLGIAFPPGGGTEEGEKILRILANHPATARHIATKLCQRLVADNPPPSLVERVSRRFLETGGDLRETVRAVVASPEFADPRYYRAKIKSPFEYVVSALRAIDATTDDALPIARQLAQMGEPLYLCQPPTGYSDAAEAWVNTGALVARLNFALSLADGRLAGTWSRAESLVSPDAAPDTRTAVSALACALVGDDLSPATRTTLEKRLGAETAGDVNKQVPLIAGLILGSPEFQRQ
ncbi:MAG TPA: DUF1800 domain-containing protein [Thermoanaerobaculia bacterium]|nr:DUF1800 domain-containing protein [Thermoanaerobaculia bacterium]